MNKIPSDATIVLVHAAWADGSSWSAVIGPLLRGGHQGYCSPDSNDLAVRRCGCFKSWRWKGRARGQSSLSLTLTPAP